MTNQTFQVGDTVNVLNSIRLPKVEQIVGYGVIERITQSLSGETLYWVSDRRMAVTGRVLRHALYRLPSGEIVRVDATAAKGAQTMGFTLADGSIVQVERV